MSTICQRCCTSSSPFEQGAWCNLKWGIPVNNNKIKSVSCLHSDAVSDTVQNWDPRLRREGNARVSVRQLRVSVGYLLPWDVMPFAKHLQFRHFTCLNKKWEGSKSTVCYLCSSQLQHSPWFGASASLQRDNRSACRWQPKSCHPWPGASVPTKHLTLEPDAALLPPSDGVNGTGTPRHTLRLN